MLGQQFNEGENRNSIFLKNPELFGEISSNKKQSFSGGLLSKTGARSGRTELFPGRRKMPVAATLSWPIGLLQQSELCHSSLCTDEYLTVHNNGSDELVSRTELIARSRLVAVIQLICQVGGVVSVKNCWIAILDRPDDPVCGPIRRNRGRSSRISERGGDSGSSATLPAWRC